EPFSIPLFSPILYRLNSFFANIGTYDFDPRISKQTLSPMGMAELAPDGSNLAIILQRIMEEPEKREQLIPLISEVLPFVEDVNVERVSGASLVASLKEIYCGRRFTPTTLLSEGTINLTAFVIALYFEEKSPIVLEEPVRNVHPHLASRIVDMIRDVSERLEKQVIITTHSPEILKYADKESLLLVKRDRLGFSSIFRPLESEELRAFLSSMGIEELYVQNLL
ncbi:MAG TPA: AAA family ATPase, partial [Methanomicrobiales archaeon]|nr:AAA family ATPase [Methanomicrobiales archaeon]